MRSISSISDSSPPPRMRMAPRALSALCLALSAALRLWMSETIQFPMAAMQAMASVAQTRMNTVVKSLFSGDGARSP